MYRWVLMRTEWMSFLRDNFTCQIFISANILCRISGYFNADNLQKSRSSKVPGRNFCKLNWTVFTHSIVTYRNPKRRERCFAIWIELFLHIQLKIWSWKRCRLILSCVMFGWHWVCFRTLSCVHHHSLQECMHYAENGGSCLNGASENILLFIEIRLRWSINITYLLKYVRWRVTITDDGVNWYLIHVYLILLRLQLFVCSTSIRNYFWF